MTQWTIRQRIAGCFGLVLLMMAAVSGAALIRAAATQAEVDKLQTDSLPGLDQAYRILVDVERNYILVEALTNADDHSPDTVLAANVRATVSEVDALTHEYGAAIVGNVDRTTFEEYVAARASYKALIQSALPGSPTRPTDSAGRVALLRRLGPAFENLRSALLTMVSYNWQNAEATAAALQSAADSARSVVVMSFVGAMFFALLAGLLLARDITKTLRRLAEVADQIASGDLAVPPAGPHRRADEVGLLTHAFDRMVTSLRSVAENAASIASGDLTATIVPQSPRDVMGNALADMMRRLCALVGDVQRSGIQVNTSITEIAATAREQQATATSTAATVSQLGATSFEILATSRELVRTISEVTTVAENAAALASGGQASLVHMHETMHNVMEAGASIDAKLTILNEKAGNINKVVMTITKVADQTNLLSLNAAIEAEKAGEYGRGFSVVATEIRRLADQTAVATYDIEQTVREIVAAISAGVMSVDRFSQAVRGGMGEVQQIGSQLTQIVSQVQALAPRVESVNAGMQSQAAGAEQISQALEHLSEAAQQTVESLQLSSTAVSDLSFVSAGMRDGIATFKLPST